MNTQEQNYLNLLQRILDTGEERNDRTGTGTIAVFGETLKFDISKTFPLLTTKRVPFRAVASELLWFVEGSGDERRLAEIHHGTRDPEYKTIWSPNAEGTTGAVYQPQFPGDLGRVYGKQWRDWQTYEKHGIINDSDGLDHYGLYNRKKSIDQLAEAIDKLKNNPTDRRIIVSAWNPGELDQMALPPCHMFYQFFRSNDNHLDCQYYMRSVDTFLGLPFNIASYSLLTYMVASVIGATPRTLSVTMGDTHIYKDHIDQVKEQLRRTPKDFPTLRVSDKGSIDDFTMQDFQILNYFPDPAIKAKMSA